MKPGDVLRIGDGGLVWGPSPLADVLPDLATCAQEREWLRQSSFLVSSSVLPMPKELDELPQYIEPPVKEAPMEWTNAKLIEAVKESKEWAACVGWRTSHGETPSVALLRAADDVVGTDNTENRVYEYRPLIGALRALVSTIRSGEVYGDENRCAVCGKGEDVGFNRAWRDVGERVRYFCAHRKCFVPHGTKSGDDIYGLDLAAAILRARRITGERKGQPNKSTPFIGVDYGKAGEVCTVTGHQTADGKFVVEGETYIKPRDYTTGVVCLKCGAKMRPDMDRDVYRCSCGWNVAGVVMRCGKHDAIQYTPPPTPPLTTAQAKAVASFRIAPPDPYLAQRDREKSPEFKAWAKEEDVACLTAALDRGIRECNAGIVDELRERVRHGRAFGLYRGRDPRPLMTGDLFGSERRGR